MIIEIRGCTGAGKSSLVRALMEKAHAYPLTKSDVYLGRIYAAKMDYNIAFLGSYKMVTGGLENRYTQDQCIQLIDRHKKQNDIVIFEGGMLSKSTGKVYQHILQHYKNEYMVMWLDSSLATCIMRLKMRRGFKKINKGPIERDMKKCLSALERIKKDGVCVMSLESGTEKALSQVLTFIKV